MTGNQVDTAPNEEQKNPGDIPPVFSESFKHAIHLLIIRFNQWETLLMFLQNYFETQKNTSNSLCNKYHDAVKALEQTCVKPSIINGMKSPTEESVDSTMKRTKAKVDKFADKFVILGNKFNFQFAKEGGVSENIARLKDHAEQIALLEEKQQVFLLNNTITKLLKLKDSIKDKQRLLKEWSDRLQDTEKLRERAITAYTDLVGATEKFKVDRDMTPLPENDPLLRWQHYRSLRASWINKMNNLQFSAIVHREECKKTENNLVDTLQTIIHDYITTTKSHNLKIKGLFSKHLIPFDIDKEWQYFESNNMHIPTPPLEIPQARKLQFQNNDHPKTRPLAEAKLFLQPVFPWSLRSRQQLRKYVVTHGGYLIKVSEDETKFPMPKRAFRLRDCVILECPPEDGTLSFVVKGINCCRDLTTNILDRRTDWKFTGAPMQVKELLDAMRKMMPVFGYRFLL